MSKSIKKLNKKLRKQLGGSGNNWETFFTRYDFHKELGRGGFGVTYLIYDKLEEKELVAKVATLNSNNYSIYLKELENLKLIYKNTCRSDLSCIRNYYIGNYSSNINQDEKQLVLLMDKADGIELRKFIDLIRNGKVVLNSQDYMFIFGNLITTLQYMHSNLNMAHMDIKPENIMIDQNTLKTTILDMGLSCKDVLCDVGGTPFYMSNQIIDKFKTASQLEKEVAKKGDIYSMGIVFLELLQVIDLYKLNGNLVWDPNNYSKSIKEYVANGIWVDDMILKYPDINENTKLQIIRKLIHMSINMVKESENLTIDNVVNMFYSIYEDSKKQIGGGRIRKLRKQSGGGSKDNSDGGGDIWEELFTRYKFLEKIGEGGYGTTYIVYDKIEKRKQVAKVAKIDSENYDIYSSELNNLMEIYNNTCRSDLICIRNYYLEPHQMKNVKQLVVIMDKVDGIELRKFIRNVQSGKIILQLEDYMFIFGNLLKTLEYIHNTLDMAHMDIKPENIMIDPKTFKTSIIDMGLSCKDIYCNAGGTSNYMSKNIIDHYETNKKVKKEDAKRSDNYSLGIVFLEMLKLINTEDILLSKSNNDNNRNSMSVEEYVAKEANYYLNTIKELINNIKSELKQQKTDKNDTFVDLINLSIIMVEKNLLISSIITIFNSIETYIKKVKDIQEFFNIKGKV